MTTKPKEQKEPAAKIQVNQQLRIPMVVLVRMVFAETGVVVPETALTRLARDEARGVVFTWDADQVTQ